MARREAEALSAFMLGSYGLMLAIAYLAEDERVLLLRDPATSGLTGLVFLLAVLGALLCWTVRYRAVRNRGRRRPLRSPRADRRSRAP